MEARALRSTTTTLLLVAAAFAVGGAQDAPPVPAPPGPSAPPPPAPPAEPGPPAILVQRRKGVKEATARNAVAAGLDWLRRHASADGRWDCDGFPAACRGAPCGDAGLAFYDPGVTGLAVLAFLGSGATPSEGPDAALLTKSLGRLVRMQDSDGCIGERNNTHFQIGHHVATMALAEAHWLTGDPKLLEPATRARDFILACQNPYLAWRYAARDGDNDTASTAYAVVALRTCEFAGLEVLRDTWTGPLAWFGKMTDPGTGRAGYQQRGGRDARILAVREVKAPDPEPPEPADPAPPARPGAPPVPKVRPAPAYFNPAMGPVWTEAVPANSATRDATHSDVAESALTACAAAATSLVGGAESAKLMEGWVRVLAAEPPNRAESGMLDLHYMLFGSLLAAQRPFDSRPAGETSRKTLRPWRTAVVDDLAAAQRPAGDGCAAGSWSASQDPFGLAGGRIYATAMAVLALEAPNRFPKVWNPKAKRFGAGGR